MHRPGSHQLQHAHLCSLCDTLAATLYLLVRVLSPSVVSGSGLLCPWDSPGKNTGVGRHSLLPRILTGVPLSFLRLMPHHVMAVLSQIIIANSRKKV